MSDRETYINGALYIGTGDRFLSKSGRPLSPVPRVDVSTSRHITNSYKRTHKWLLTECVEEAKLKYDNHNLTLLAAIDLNNLRSADIGYLNVYLFDNEHGPTEAHLLEEPRK